MRAVVVFHGRGNGALARVLAPGFRHCFVCIEDNRGIWIRFDGRAGISISQTFIAMPASRSSRLMTCARAVRGRR